MKNEKGVKKLKGFEAALQKLYSFCVVAFQKFEGKRAKLKSTGGVHGEVRWKKIYELRQQRHWIFEKR